MDVDQVEKASKFFSSTAELDRMSLYQGAHSSPLAGHGFGLGIARLYCSYWGGMDITHVERASKFFSSTAELDQMSLYQGAHSSPLAGHGFGLGIAGLYCSYWGGSLLV